MNKQIVSFVLAIGTSVAMSASVFAADFTSSPSTEDISPKIEQYFSEIDQYMISHPELCKLDSANFTKTAEVPLSNGETAIVSLSQPITVYSQITLDAASTGNNDIYVVATNHI